jgi:hypothetical protein
MNAKNSIQEYYQKRKQSLPEYTSVRVGGTDNEPLWQSSVTTIDGEYLGEICNNKKQADLSAAQIALTKLPVEKIVYEKVVGRVALFVDVENLPHFADEAATRFGKNMVIYAFVGKHHHLSDKKFSPGIIKIISPSTRSDGNDSYIQVYIGWLLAQHAFDTFLIATLDHFGSALADAINDPDGPWFKIEARVVNKITHI